MVPGLLKMCTGKFNKLESLSSLESEVLSYLEKLCSVLNMPKAMSDDAFSDSVAKIKNALELEATLSMKKAAKEEHDAFDTPEDQVIE